MKKVILILIVGCSMVALIISSCKKEQGMSYNPSSPIVIDSFTPSQGNGNTEILISGHNFSSDTSQLQVMIGERPIKVVAANTNQIMAIIPKKCGSGLVTVKIGSSTAKSQGTFTYLFTHTVTTLAGGGEAGYSNAKGKDAQFNFSNPNWLRSLGIAVDDDLNVYVADAGNHCIRKIDSAGNVTTLAGNPNVSGYKDGKGLEAQFNIPYDIALDNAGNLYTADPGNYDIRKISPTGEAVTLFFASISPWSVAVDPTGKTIYVTGCESPAGIYKYDSPFNNANQIIGGLNYPTAIRLDKQGNLYCSLNGDNDVMKFTAGSWTPSVLAGSAGNAGYLNGIGSEARFSLPWGMGLDNDGNMYIAGNGTWDGGNPDQSIRLVEQGTWNVSTYAGSGAAGYSDGIGSGSSFNGPGGVCVDKNGTVYVLDKNNNAVRKIVSE